MSVDHADVVINVFDTDTLWEAKLKELPENVRAFSDHVEPYPW